jgi:tRNA dimethylallyltransferase
LGYKQLGLHLDGQLTLEEAVVQTKSATSAYARRQRTWFRREPADVRASSPPDPDALVRDLSNGR